jgi:hypothetical protein
MCAAIYLPCPLTISQHPVTILVPEQEQMSVFEKLMPDEKQKINKSSLQRINLEHAIYVSNISLRGTMRM